MELNPDETLPRRETESVQVHDVVPDGDRPRLARARRRTLTVAGVGVGWPLLVAHVALLAAGLGYWAYLDRKLWFYGDEWDFIDRRGVFHAAVSIWTPHNEHWSTLPILLWRAIYNVFHLSSYWPYLIPLFAAHLLIVHLVWRRMLKEGVPPWVATALGGLLALLGSGWEDLGWAFQIGFLGSVLFGLLAVDLADRKDAGWGWDALTAAVSLAAFMCSTIGDAVWVALFVMLLRTRPWQRAARVLAPPLICYLVWFELAGKKAVSGDHVRLHTFYGLPQFMWSEIVSALGSRHVLLGALVAVVFGIWLARHARRVVLDHPAAVGLFLAALAFWGLAGIGRDRFGDVTPDRYTYIGVALMLPLIGIALGDQVRRRWRWWPVRPIAVLAVLGVVVGFTYGNIVLGKHAMAGRVAFVQKQHRLILNGAQLIADGHPYVLSYRFPESSLNAKYALRLWKLHQIPHVGRLSPTTELYYATRLDVALTITQRSRGEFDVVGHFGNAIVPSGPGCDTLTPTDPAANPAVPPAVRFRMVGSETAASALLRTPTDVDVYVGLRPRGRLTRAIVRRVSRTGQQLKTGQLVTGEVQTNPLASATYGPKVPGVSYLYDVQPGADLVVTLPRRLPVQFCHLAPTPPAHRPTAAQRRTVART